MILSSLIHKKSKSGEIATATAATPATHDGQAWLTVANVASVAVANYPMMNSLLPHGPEQVFIDEREGEPLQGEQFSYEEDDRHHCRQCSNLRGGYCIKQRFRPVDDIPRRCDDFNGYPCQIGQQVSGTIAPAPAANPLLVEVWTPSGTSMTTRADNAEHAEWLRQKNPKPTNPALKPDPAPEHDADRISETEHNAQGRFFKYLVTRSDGTQFYSCAMPRQTLEETRAQYPNAAVVEPVFWKTEKISP